METSKKLSTKKKIYKHSLSESQIQSKFISKLSRCQPTAFIVKLSDKWVSGMPDVMMILEGKACFYEIKTDKGVVSKIQKITHDALRKAGASVDIVKGGDFN